jgi:hypothetical protein
MAKSQKRYYTPCNVGIYIGGLKVSDAFRVDWDARDSKTPLYGWADETFSGISNGRKVVTGRIILNYTHPQYLTKLIAEMTSTDQEAGIHNPELAAFFSKTGTDRVAFVADLAAKNFTDLVNSIPNLEQYDPTLFGNTIRVRSGGGSKVPPMQPYQMKNTFDIVISYGDMSNEDHIETTIKDAYIVGQSQVISASATGGGDISSSGSPIYEVYSFFAKEIVAERRVARVQ